jgi:hypothetical protein
LWTENLCFRGIIVFFSVQMPSLSAKEQESHRNLKTGHICMCKPFQWDLFHSVACTRLFERTKWRTICYMIYLCVFLSKIGRYHYFGLFSLLYHDWCKHLTFHWETDRRKEGQHFLLLSYSVSFEENKQFIVFLFWETGLSLFLCLATSWTLRILTALPCLFSDS